MGGPNTEPQHCALRIGAFWQSTTLMASNLGRI